LLALYVPSASSKGPTTFRRIMCSESRGKPTGF
jgi:hypothetical protein